MLTNIMLICIIISIISTTSATTDICQTLKYGKYCGVGYSNKYGAKPDDIMDEYCHKHDICTTIGLTNQFCNCQMVYYAMNHNTKTQSEETMRECMLYWGAAACGVSTFYGYSYDKRVVIPVINVASKGFSYYTLFNFDNISHTYYIRPSNQYLYLTTFTSMDEYNTYAYYAYDSGFQFALHPSSEKLQMDKFTKFSTDKDTIIVVSNIRIGETYDSDVVEIHDMTVYEDISIISNVKNESSICKSQLNETSINLANSVSEHSKCIRSLDTAIRELSSISMLYDILAYYYDVLYLQYSDLQTMYSTLSTNNSITASELLSCRNASTCLKSQIANLNNLITELKSQIANLEKTKSDMLAIIAALNVENAKLTASNTELSGKIVILEKNISVISSERDSNAASRDAYIVKYNDMSGRYNDMSIKYNDMSDKYNDMSLKYSILEQNSTYDKLFLSNLLNLSNGNIAIVASILGISCVVLVVVVIVSIMIGIYAYVKKNH